MAIRRREYWGPASQKQSGSFEQTDQAVGRSFVSAEQLQKPLRTLGLNWGVSIGAHHETLPLRVLEVPLLVSELRVLLSSSALSSCCLFLLNSSIKSKDCFALT